MPAEPPTSPSPGEDPPLPDEVWEQFVKDSERDIRASAPKEPSARARMVTERLRQQDAEAAQRQKALGRRGSGNGERAQPEGWRTGPGWQETNGRASRRRPWRVLLGVLVVVGLAVVALNPSGAWSWVRDRTGGGTAVASGGGTLPPCTPDMAKTFCTVPMTP